MTNREIMDTLYRNADTVWAEYHTGQSKSANVIYEGTEYVIFASDKPILDEVQRRLEMREWHTEPPTEDGQYFVAYRWGLDNQIMHDMAKQICYGATTFFHGTWKVEFPFIVLAWQKREPFVEAST